MDLKSLLSTIEDGVETAESLCCGFLWKQISSNWRSRWYSLQAGALSAFSTPQGARFGPPFTDIAEVLSIEGRLERGQGLPPLLPIKIVQSTSMGGSTEVLYAEGEAEHSRWMTSLSAAAAATAVGLRGLPLCSRYDINYASLLGSGMFAVVFTAVELATGLTRAFKIIKPDAFQEYQDLLQRELMVWSAVGVDHNRIVGLVEAMRSDNSMYFVSELAQGGSLLSRLAVNNSYCEHDTAVIMYQVLDALAHIHSRGAVHCDVKPENICMATKAPDSPIKLIDFSLAAFFMHPMSPGGTPEFVAPELLISPQHYASNGCGPAVDIWSAGVVFYYLLSGRTPFHAASVDGIISKVKSGSWSFSPASAWARVSEPAKALVSMMLQIAPESRPSAKDLLKSPWFSQPAGPGKPLTEAISIFKAHEQEQKSKEKKEQAELPRPKNPYQTRSSWAGNTKADPFSHDHSHQQRTSRSRISHSGNGNLPPVYENAGGFHAGQVQASGDSRRHTLSSGFSSGLSGSLGGPRASLPSGASVEMDAAIRMFQQQQQAQQQSGRSRISMNDVDGFGEGESVQEDRVSQIMMMQQELAKLREVAAQRQREQEGQFGGTVQRSALGMVRSMSLSHNSSYREQQVPALTNGRRSSTNQSFGKTMLEGDVPGVSAASPFSQVGVQPVDQVRSDAVNLLQSLKLEQQPVGGVRQRASSIGDRTSSELDWALSSAASMEADQTAYLDGGRMLTTWDGSETFRGSPNQGVQMSQQQRPHRQQADFTRESAPANMAQMRALQQQVAELQAAVAAKGSESSSELRSQNSRRRTETIFENFESVMQAQVGTASPRGMMRNMSLQHR